MAQPATGTLLRLVDALIEEGKVVLATSEKGSPGYVGGGVAVMPSPGVNVEMQPMAKWRAGCLNLMRLLGKAARPWEDIFSDKGGRYIATAEKMAGTLEGIKSAIQDGMLVTVEDLIFAEAFSDLLEQAEHLLSGGYFLAAGVLGRAVLEEHLRKWCDKESCVPTGAKPTLNSFQVELQKAGHLNKTEAAHVLSMAAIGNTAAHNLPGLTQAGVERLIRDVREFLVRHPLA